jgi:hypothetical protein
MHPVATNTAPAMSQENQNLSDLESQPIEASKVTEIITMAAFRSALLCVVLIIGKYLNEISK